MDRIRVPRGDAVEQRLRRLRRELHARVGRLAFGRRVRRRFGAALAAEAAFAAIEDLPLGVEERFAAQLAVH